MSSVFSKIVAGEIPCHKVYEDEQTLAFLDIDPITEGHTLVIPKKEVDKLYDLDDETYQAVMKTVKHVARMIETSLGVVRVGMSVHGFDVPHAHVHLIPMNDPADMHRSRAGGEPDHEALGRVAERIRQA